MMVTEPLYVAGLFQTIIIVPTTVSMYLLGSIGSHYIF